ncbi:MAG: beta-xylosidase [Burkholderiales bacterium]|nr:beta-xylosidase [Phycisphaerae bacterium]
MSIRLQADVTGPAKPYHRFWNVCVGAGRANEGLRATWLEHLDMVVEACGFQYVRFHGLFHDDMFVYRNDADVKGVYNFQYIDDLFDRLLSAGIKPFVELGFCPGDLARERGTVFWWKGNGSPPLDYDKWAELVARTVRHWIDRYGIAEVRTWYFEVWNEPNLHPFFKGTRSEYFKLYQETAGAIKQIDSQLRVGGPATSNFVPDARFDGETEDISHHAGTINASDLDALDWKPVWLAEFLDFCSRQSLPVDFISCHPYPTDWALDAHGETVKSTRGVDATRTDLSRLRTMVDASAFPAAEIHLTEWSSSPSPRDHTHDHLQAATFVVKTNLESIGLVDSLSYWVFTDVFEESGAGNSAFHGGFGMINYQGIVKPTFHAYRFLNQLGDEIVRQENGIIVTRDSATSKIAALAYHYPPEVPQSVPASFDSRDVAEQTLATGSPTELNLTLTGLASNAVFTIETLDRRNGNALAAWGAMGNPDPLGLEQTHLLQQAALATRSETVLGGADGTLTLARPIDAWSLVMIREL